MPVRHLNGVQNEEPIMEIYDDDTPMKNAKSGNDLAGIANNFNYGSTGLDEYASKNANQLQEKQLNRQRADYINPIDDPDNDGYKTTVQTY